MFLSGWDRGNAKPPTIEYPPVSYADQRSALQKLAKQLTSKTPLETYTAKTIDSYITATGMIEAVGTPTFTQKSIEIYGAPSDKMPGSSTSNVEAAEKLIAVANRFLSSSAKELDTCISAQQTAEFIRKKAQARFGPASPEVVIADQLSAKATASSRTIRLRNATCYTTYDDRQLLEHEVMTHALTAMNGHRQPLLPLLGQACPRTTRTQEGLASFAEVITGAIDIRRLRRIALRVVAIDNALKGASFIDTFQFFLDNTESQKEAFWSSARVFRGGYPDKNIVFTKDGVYLDGLIKVHTLFHWALMNDRLCILNLLFCGRLTIDDCFLLEDSYKSGEVVPPTFIPDWFERIDGLVGQLSFSLLTNMIDLSDIENYFNSGRPKD